MTSNDDVIHGLLEVNKEQVRERERTEVISEEQQQQHCEHYTTLYSHVQHDNYESAALL